MKTTHVLIARTACALLILACGMPGMARKPRVMDEPFLQPTERELMAGKTVAIAITRPSPHTRIVDGDFWKAGIGATVGVVPLPGRFDAFGSVDPVPSARTLLSDLLRDAYGMRVLTFDDRLALNGKTKYLAQRYPEADYVLSIEGRSMHGEWLAGKGGRAGVGMTLRLVNVATQHDVAYGDCGEMTKKDDAAPTLSELESNDGQRIKDVLKVLAAKCVRTFASQRLRAKEDSLAAFPRSNQDPFLPVVTGNGS